VEEKQLARRRDHGDQQVIIKQLIQRVRQFQSLADSQIQQYKSVADAVNDIDVRAIPLTLSGLTVTATEHAERLLALQDTVQQLDVKVAAAADEQEVEVALAGAVPAQLSMEQKVSSRTLAY
jgi:hypothetical protein